MKQTAQHQWFQKPGRREQPKSLSGIETQGLLREELTVRRRPVNKHNKIKEMTNQVGASLGRENLNPIGQADCAPAAEEVIVQFDGGHLPLQEKDKRSFEALSVVVYRPENIREIDNHHREIEDKSCAMSALDDDLDAIKTYILNTVHGEESAHRQL